MESLQSIEDRTRPQVGGCTALALTTVGFFHRYEKTAYGLFGETGSRLPEEAQSNKNRAAPEGTALRFTVCKKNC